jgi:hypothetical protein
MLKPLLVSVTCLGLMLKATGAAQGQSFALLKTYVVGTSASNPRGIVVSDINRDGLPDLLTANYQAATIGVLLGQPTGGWAASAPVSAGSTNTPYDVAAADLNKDGYPDVVTANYLSHTVGVLLNTPQGTFAAVVPYAVNATSYPESLVLADVNQDSYPDIITGDLGATTVSVLLNQRDGTFTLAGTYAIASSCLNISVATGDLNQDGYLDIITATAGGPHEGVGLLLNKRDGTFEAVTTYPTSPGSQPYGVAVGDVNGDGYPDVCTANYGTSTSDVFLTQKTGGLSSPRAYSTGSSSYPTGIALGDLNGDTYLDLVTSNSGSDTASLLLNQQDGTFASALISSTGPGSAPYRVAVGAIPQDGRVAILTANSGTGTVGVLTNQLALAGTPRTPATQLLVYPNPVAAGNQVAVRVTSGLPVGTRRLEARWRDPLGRVAAHATLSVNQQGIQAGLPTTGLNAGLYLLELTTQDGQGTLLTVEPPQRVWVY